MRQSNVVGNSIKSPASSCLRRFHRYSLQEPTPNRSLEMISHPNSPSNMITMQADIVACLEKELSNALAVAEQHLARAKDAEVQLQESQGSNDTLTRENEEFLADLDSIITENEVLTQRIDSLERENEELSKQVGAVTRERDVLDSELEVQAKQGMPNQGEITLSVEQLREQMKGRQKHAATERRSMQDMIQSLTQERDVLEHQLNNKSSCYAR